MARYHLLNLFALAAFYFSSAQEMPTPRASGHLFYFKPSQSLILLDGYDKGTTPPSGKAEIWSWKNNKWNKIDSSNQPTRSLSGATYIGDKNLVFLYGGIGKRGYDDSLREAYTYDGKGWNVVVSNFIGTRDHHEIAYDENSKTIIVYGGQNAKREFDLQTWLFKNNVWKALNIPGPGPRAHHAMAYDAERKRIVLYGGNRDNIVNETWEFDGAQWNKIISPVNPGGRAHHSMVYDPHRKKVLLYGGENDTGTKGDIWAWDGKAWELLSDNGPARILPAAAFNVDNNKLYVFGGNGGENGLFIYSDLWEWDGKKWTQIEKGKTYKWDMQKDMYLNTQ